MLFNLLLKAQHFAIPLSVTVSEAKNFSSRFLQMIIKPGKSRKGEKPTSEKRRKINGLNAAKIELNGTFLRFLQIIIKPGKSRKGEKPTSEKRRKINGLNAAKIELNGTFFIWKFFFEL